MINSAKGQPGSGGRIDARKDLNKGRVSLEGLDASSALGFPTPQLTTGTSQSEVVDINVAPIRNYGYFIAKFFLLYIEQQF